MLVLPLHSEPVVVGEVERDDVGVVEGEIVLVVDGVDDSVGVRDVEGVEVGLVDGVLVRDVVNVSSEWWRVT